MKKISIEQLTSKKEKEYRKAVKYYANSEMPNGYFLQHLTGTIEEYAKQYGEVKLKE